MDIRHSICSLLIVSAALPCLSPSQPKWIQQNSGTTASLSSIAFFDSATGLAAGNGTMLKTTNGGTSWFALASRDTTQYIAMDISGAGKVTAVGMWLFFHECGMGTIQVSNDTGGSWDLVTPDTSVPYPYGGLTPVLMGVSTPSDSFGYVVSGCDDFTCTAGAPLYIFRTTNGGLTWWEKPVVHRCIEGSYWSAWDVSFVSDSVGLISGEKGLMLRTDDGADSLVTQTTGTTAGLFSVDMKTDSFAVAAGDLGVIIRTTDGGTTWTPGVSGITTPLYAIRFLDEKEGFAVGKWGVILHSVDGGNSWEQENSGTGAELLGISFPDSDNVWICGGGGIILKRNIYRSAYLPFQELQCGPAELDSAIIDSLPVINTGTGRIRLSCQSDNPEFHPEDSCAVLLPGDTSWIRIQFRPSHPGNRAGILTINHQLPEAPWMVTLRGTGTEWASSSIPVQAKWNLVSINRETLNDSVGMLFPSAISEAYKYDTYFGYQASSRIIPGTGYWLKFPAADSVSTTGFTIMNDTIFVRTGWNLIGTIAAPIPVSSIITTPPGLVISGFYGFADTFVPSPVLFPGRGYWVKVKSDGKLYLNAP